MTLFHKLETVLNVFSYYFTLSKFYCLIPCFILYQSIVGTQGNKKPGSVLPGRANPSVRVSCQRTKEFIYTFLNDLFNIKFTKDDGEDEDETTQWEAKALLKPEDQLTLTEAELKEEITRILKANNPNAPQNIVRFSHKDHTYKLIPHVEQLAIHFQIDGNLIHKESEEAKRQMSKGVTASTSSDDAPPKAETTASTATSAKAADDDDEEGKSKGGEKQLKNQFNFSERASQTYNNPARERSTMTEPPPRSNFSSNVSQWEIYDAYIEDFEEQVRKSFFQLKYRKEPPYLVPGTTSVLRNQI